MSFFSRISSLFSRRSIQLAIVGILAFFLLGPIGLRDHSIVYSGGISTVWAVDPQTPQKDKNATDEMVENMVAFLNIILGVITFLITPLVMLAGWLLSPDWTFGEIFGLRAVFHNIWILISNVVYVIFAFILVTIAFMNIFWGGHDHAYEIKKALPKLVVSILIVPFTWFIVSAVLSIANVLTASVIQLPVDMLGQTTNGSDILDQRIIPKEIVYEHGNDYGTGWSSNCDSDGMDCTNYETNGSFKTSDCSKDGAAWCLTLKEFLTSGWGGAYNLIAAYAYGIFQVQKYKEISNTELPGLKSTGDIVKKLIFGALFFLIFGILVIAIVYALFSRALMLWGFAMFSPLFALNYFFEHVKMGEKAKKSIDQFTISKFISLALVPVYVAAALAFGLMFVGSVVNMKTTEWEGVAKITSEADATTFAIWPVSLKTIGLLSGADLQAAKWVLQAGGNIIGTIIVNVLALVILWMAVMAALKADDITGAAVKPIADMGDELGKLMKSAPQYIPLTPSGQSMKSMAQGMQGVKWGIEQAVSAKAGDVTRKFGFWSAADRNQAFTELSTAAAAKNHRGAVEALRKIEKSYTDLNEAVRDGKFRESVARLGNMDGLELGLKAEELTTREKVVEAYRKIDEKLEHGGYGDLIHGKRWSTVRDDDIAWRFGASWSNAPATANPARYGAKSDTQDMTLNVTIGGAPTPIALERTTVLQGQTITLTGTDKDKLHKIIESFGTNDSGIAAAKARLKEIFDSTAIDIDKLYDAIK